MGEITKLLTEKPFFDYTDDERQKLLDLMATCVKEGKKLILGQTRCFFCGKELDDVLEKRQVGLGNPLIMTNLCHDCFNMKDTQDYINKGIR